MEGNSDAQVAKFDVNVSGDLSVSPSSNDVLFNGFLGSSPLTKNIVVTNNSEVTVDVMITVSGTETMHTLSLLPSSFSLAPDASKQVAITITPKEGVDDSLVDSVTINIDATQKD